MEVHVVYLWPDGEEKFCIGVVSNWKQLEEVKGRLKEHFDKNDEYFDPNEDVVTESFFVDDIEIEDWWKI